MANPGNASFKTDNTIAETAQHNVVATVKDKIPVACFVGEVVLVLLVIPAAACFARIILALAFEGTVWDCRHDGQVTVNPASESLAASVFPQAQRKVIGICNSPSGLALHELLEKAGLANTRLAMGRLPKSNPANDSRLCK